MAPFCTGALALTCILPLNCMANMERFCSRVRCRKGAFFSSVRFMSSWKYVQNTRLHYQSWQSTTFPGHHQGPYNDTACGSWCRRTVSDKDTFPSETTMVPLLSNSPLWDCQSLALGFTSSVNIPLKRDHPSYVTSLAWHKGWSHKRGTTVISMHFSFAHRNPHEASTLLWIRLI